MKRGFLLITGFCFVQVSILFAQPSFQISPATSQTDVCPDAIIGLNANASGGTGPYSYQWTGQGIFTSPRTDATDVVIPDVTGQITYTITAIDLGTNDTIIDSIVVDVHGIYISLGNDTTIACLDSIDLVAQLSGDTIAYFILWQNAATTDTLYGVKAGAYSATVTNSVGCSASDAVKVDLPINQNIEFEIGTVCLSDTLTMGVNATTESLETVFINTSTYINGWNWQWNFGDPGQPVSTDANPSLSYPIRGTYYLSIDADSAGCSFHKSESIAVLSSSLIECGMGEWPPIGIANIDAEPNFTVSPNPFNNYIELLFEEAAQHQIEVYNTTGQLVYKQTDYGKSFNIVTENWQPGYYLINVDNTQLQRVLLQR